MSHWIQQLRENDNAAYLIYLLLLLIFAADSQTQLGFAHGVLYAPLLLLTSLTDKLRLLHTIFIAAVVLIWLGVFTSPAAPQGFSFIFVLANRAGACVCLLLIYLQMRAVIYLHLQQNRQRADMEMQKQQLQLANKLTKFARWTLDTHTSMVRLSAEAKALLPNASRTRFTLSQFSSLFQGPYQAVIQQLMSDYLEQQQPFDIECPCQLDGKTEHWVRIVGYASVNPEATMQGIVQEINSAHQVKMRLAQEQQRFKYWADSMPIFVWAADNTGAVTFVSQMLLNYTGLTAEQLIANWLDVVHPDDRQHVSAHWLHCVQSGDAYSIEFRIRRHDGCYIWHLTKAVAEYGSDGNVEKWLGSAMAISVAAKKPDPAKLN
ncbi:PAS domain S-box-containing protein [Rheinheimera pacifica]|uniref:PAS domain-containing protein n=1 Tax=Rheinheimera pacifica TaxID=173990 RepID=UPI002865C954|nr:PAS domain-containing protein [Rheinheimera pacifica]MDR6984105.1 PAS domain S-box-containing protein [Rheinheimera pacifica]